jgi:hypothetical protein
MSDMNPAAGTGAKLTVKVTDEKGAPIDSVQVKAVIHYPTEGVETVLKGKAGTYAAMIDIKDSLAPGTTVLIDVYASYKTLSSTARAAFTVR